jgi:hypothetical protein
MANKARLIRETLETGQYDPEFCRRELLEHHPYAWLIELDGLIVDARALPAHLRAAARQRGLIPTRPKPDQCSPATSGTSRRHLASGGVAPCARPDDLLGHVGVSVSSPEGSRASS